MEWKQDLIVPERFVGELVESGSGPWAKQYVEVRMPKPYDGYHFLHPETLVRGSARSGFWTLTYNDEFVFTLVKSEREEGKRYKRHKLNIFEMKEIFDPFVNRYLDEVVRVGKGRISQKSVGFSSGAYVSYCYGVIDKKKFYPMSGASHSLNARNFTLIQEYGQMTRRQLEAALAAVNLIESDLQRMRDARAGMGRTLYTHKPRDFYGDTTKEVFETINIMQNNLIFQYDIAIAELEIEVLNIFEKIKLGNN